MGDQTEQQDEGLLSANAKPFLPQKAPTVGIPASIPEDGYQDEYRTPVVVRSLSNIACMSGFVGGSLQRPCSRCRSVPRCLVARWRDDIFCRDFV